MSSVRWLDPKRREPTIGGSQDATCLARRSKSARPTRLACNRSGECPTQSTSSPTTGFGSRDMNTPNRFEQKYPRHSGAGPERDRCTAAIRPGRRAVPDRQFEWWTSVAENPCQPGGSSTEKQAPPSGAGPALMVPPSRVTRLCASASPSPAPPGRLPRYRSWSRPRSNATG